MPNPNKLTVGNIGYRYPSTRQREHDSGIMVEMIPGTEAHVKIRRLDGTAYIADQNRVGDAGKPLARTGKAIVKQTNPVIELALQHKEWPVKEITDQGWALAQDPWKGKWHWLPPRTEGGDHLYNLERTENETEGQYRVTMQGLVLEE